MLGFYVKAVFADNEGLKSYEGEPMRTKALLGVLSSILFLTLFSSAQMQGDKTKRASPPEQAVCKFNDSKTVTVNYSSPRMKGRQIYGGLVPYGKVWRTGANEATSFVTDADLTIGGVNVPAGKYTMYTLPGQNDWKLIINKQTGQWGTEYDEKQDLARIEMKTEPLVSPTENFTIGFDLQGANDCRMRLEWERTRAYVDIKEKQ